jgi:poly(3-hydroxybutyrate) depolymerase
MPMLYMAYDFQRSWLASMGAMAKWSANMLENPANPFAYFGGGPVMASALDVFAHAAEPRGKPAFGLDTTLIDGRIVPVREEIVLCGGQPQAADRRANVWPFRDAAARHG